MKTGKIHLIPNTLGTTSTETVLPPSLKTIIESCDAFVVENERNARRFIKATGAANDLDKLTLLPLNKHTNLSDIPSYIKKVKNGATLGLVSEAGCPAVADPGAIVVELAHKENIEVIPHTGPSSILLTLMASGFNGQNFAFVGYLPKENGLRVKAIKRLEGNVKLFNQTQLFIETPFRNDKMFQELIKTCSPDTLLCIATDITLPSESIKTKSIKDWRGNAPNINKRNTVFAIGR